MMILPQRGKISVEFFKIIISSRGATLPNSDGQYRFQTYVNLAFEVKNMTLLWSFGPSFFFV